MELGIPVWDFVAASHLRDDARTPDLCFDADVDDLANLVFGHQQPQCELVGRRCFGVALTAYEVGNARSPTEDVANPVGDVAPGCDRIVVGEVADAGVMGSFQDPENGVDALDVAWVPDRGCVDGDI
jgi:hypothetical protein